MLQRRAPCERGRIHLSQHRLHHLGNVRKLDLFVVDLRGHLERKILREHEVDLVPVTVTLFGFAQMRRDQRAKPAFTIIQRGHLQEMTELMHHDPLVHRVRPLVYWAEDLQIGFLREVALRLRKGEFDFQLFRERQIDREHRARFFPLCLPRALRSSRGRDIQRCSRLVHGCLTTQSQGPCRNRTATALRPSWYCLPTTVASARPPSPPASLPTPSPPSSGRFERKIACSGPPNSTTAPSPKMVPPPPHPATSIRIQTRLGCENTREHC